LVRPYQSGAPGLVAKITRAIVVGPIARLELLPVEPGVNPGAADRLIEAQMTAKEFVEVGLKEGDTVTVAPQKARVFLKPPVAA
jgi:sulfate transport system ATP-binding protein